MILPDGRCTTERFPDDKTKFTADEIKERLLEFCCMMSFEYHGLQCGIDPFNPQSFDVFCGDKNWDVDSIDAVMNGNFFDGKCLNDIAGEIEIYDW